MTFPIVAIGASTGGLEAISELLEALPARTGMSYIAVQHLSPHYESLLPEILSSKTSLSVRQVRGDMEVEEDHLYLLAPNTTITLERNVIRVLPRASGVHHPADILFASVAQDRAELAIGVVLSGGDSDGALGTQAIKQAGGITFAQEPASAKAPSMPQAAIATGCVDLVRRPADIARELIRLAGHSSLRSNGAESGSSDEATEAAAPSNEALLRRIFQRVRAAHGLDFSHYKRSTLRRRLQRRMAFNDTDDPEAYEKLLAADTAEVAALYQDFLIRVTGFFRDPVAFETLQQRVFPAICGDRPAKAPVRIWVPGCATGEEVYSIAMTLMEFLSNRPAPPGIQIFGTDVSETALDTARSGVYLENVTQDVSAQRLERFFVRQNGQYRISKAIRDLCVFARHDIIRDPPFSRLDLVSCRNLLIYLEASAQRRVMANFHYALRPRGFLLLGPSESVGVASNLFEAIGQYRRLYAPSAVVPGADGPRHGALPSHLSVRPMVKLDDPAVLESDLALREADRLMLTRYAPASVLIDDNLNILQFRGETGPYLEHASGISSLNLPRVVRPELLTEIAPAIRAARDTGNKVVCPPRRLDDNPEVNIEVVPLRLVGAERFFLIIFEGSSRTGPVRRPSSSSAVPESEKDRQLAQLQQEISSLRDYLQATIEEHEANQEELKSAHEEVLSASEEFQSTNEELETAKEELQSANEELTTTNEELRQRNRELGDLNSALDQTRQATERAQIASDIIVDSIREPLLVIDDTLHVVRANRAYQVEFDVRAADVEGRYLYHINEGQWNSEELRGAVLDVLARGETIEDFELSQVFPKLGRRTMSLNVRRMVSQPSEPARILLAIADVTARNERSAQLATEAKRKDEFLAMLAHELRNPLAPISTAVKILRDGSSESSTTDLHDMIDRQTQRLGRLVDELLDIGRFSRGLIELRRAPVSLVTIAQQSIAAMRPQVEARQHVLTVALPDEAVYVIGDPVRLEQVIANLLENASKYTQPGGHIAVTLRCREHEALLSIRDDGVGIAPDMLEEIFGLFSQVQRPAELVADGLGIGLTLVRRVLELHGGRVEARSDGLGLGSEFLVRLPSIPAPQATASSHVRVESRLDRRPTAKRVLIVEDNDDVRRSLALLVRSWGYEVVEAASGSEAIAVMEHSTAQIALVDIGMPGMNGYQLARHLRALPQYASVQLVAMTGFGREEDRRAANAAGFNRHLVKPVSFDELEALLADGR